MDTISQQLIDKTLKELSAAEKPQQETRVWTDPEGYQRLGAWQNAALLRVTKGTDVKGEPNEPNHPYFLPLSTLHASTLTYEIFMELINKTDWLLRKLVESLELKLSVQLKHRYEK
jgi:hypothetical protein